MIKHGWHFCKDVNGQPVLRDGSPCPTAGAIEVYVGTPILCEQGLHWSERAIDALGYAPGTWVRLVEGEPTETAKDKLVGRERRTLAGPVNVERMLRGFAALCALRALRRHADTKTRDACMPIVRCTLTYWRTGQWPEDRYADSATARYAAWAATCAAAQNAARAADRAADWVSAWAGAWDAARYATRAATWYADRGADWDAERDWQNRLLNAMLRKALEVRP